MDDEPLVPPRLAAARDRLRLLARDAGVVQRQCGLTIDPDDFVESTLKFGLLEVRAWLTFFAKEC